MSELQKCLIKEIQIQKAFLKEPVQTIYFGGGTPSLLSSKEMRNLISAVYENFEVDPSPEITMECNPDDLSPEYLKELKSTGINRLSIGIQSLFDEELELMNRAHNRKQALESIRMSRGAGFENINVDLIFAIPGGSEPRVMDSLLQLLEEKPEHFSTYGLTIEPKTVFGNWVRNGKLMEEDEENSARQFESIMQTLKSSGYEQYEISNFALPGFESKHNSNYWKGKSYLGIGPGAHSFNGTRRQFNIRNNRLYIKALQENKLPIEFEDLTLTQQINEYIITSLRTRWGCDLDFMKEKFNCDLFSLNKNYLEELIAGKFLELKSNQIILTDKGKLIADSITEKLFIDED